MAQQLIEKGAPEVDAFDWYLALDTIQTVLTIVVLILIAAWLVRALREPKEGA